MSQSSPKRIVVAFGTRPEATKIAPVIEALHAQDGLEPIILVTGQQKEQLYSALKVFGLKPDADLETMTDRQTLPGLASRILPAAAAKLRELEADYVLVHGDTLTTFCMAWTSFLEGIPVGHVEAGLRSGNMKEPFPEEANRRLTGVLTDLDFAPTRGARENLLREGKPLEQIFVTGQTAVDAVRSVAARTALEGRWQEQLERGKRLVTVTMHRRENWPVLSDLAGVLRRLAFEHPETHFVYPVHLNPTVREAVYPVLEGLENFELTAPLDYAQMTPLMRSSALLITDSGGLQEEGASLGVPVAVLRNVTERPEGLEAGVLKLAGTEPEAAYQILKELLSVDSELERMRGRPNPYGDGQAGRRVAEALAWRFKLRSRPQDWADAD